MKFFFKKNYPEILSIFIAIVILLFTCLLNHTYPLGDHLLPKFDGYLQYAGFTNYLRNVLLGKESLFYSFNGMLGFNYYANAIYYTFNPTNIFTIFFKQEKIMQYYTFIIFLRIGLSSLTMCKYLKYKYKNTNINTYIIFSIIYALMGYNITYYFNYMYFDTIVLFPLVIMGLEKLIHERKNKQYIITLTLSILSNFYIGFMVCIFSLIYFIYEYILLEKKDKKVIKDFIISSLLSGLMCSIILLPVVYELTQGKIYVYQKEIQTNYFDYNLNFLNIFYKFTPGSIIIDDIKYGKVNIYVTMFVFALIIKYFYNKNISKKEKIATAIIIIFYLISISFNLIDYAWHLFQRPIWFPNRYIFTFSFFLINVACKCYTKNDYKKLKIKDYLIIIFLFIGLSIYPAFDSEFNDSIIKIISYIFGIILLLEYLYLTQNKNKFTTMFLLYTIIIEITFNSILTITELKTTSTLSGYEYSEQIQSESINYIKSKEKNNDFYRMEFNKSILYNNGLIYDYNGINFFSSIRNGKITNFFKKYLNYTARDDANLIFNNKNPYITSILGIKYISGYKNEDYYKKLYDKYEDLIIYINEEALPLGFAVNKNIHNFNFSNANEFKNTNEIVNTMLGDKKIIYTLLNNYKFKDVIITDKTVIHNTENAYITIEGKAKKDSFLIYDKNALFFVVPTIYINGKEISDYNLREMPIKINKDDKYKIIFKSNYKKYDLKFIEWYLFDVETYKEVINELKNNPLKIINHKKDNNITSTINIKKDKTTLFTSIPYDKGWRISVNGKNQKYKKCYESFICIDLKEGNNEIKFKFTPIGFIIGSLISLLSLFLTIIYTRKK